ncbi:MAG: alpha/beta hydrolase [Devosia sp.]
MPHILFIHGAGEGAWEADSKLAESLRQHLGPGYTVHVPQMVDEDNPDLAAWSRQIAADLGQLGDGTLLVGHSFGGSVIARAFCDGLATTPGAIFLISAPFWGADPDWHLPAAELPTDAAQSFPQGAPVFLYHGTTDETVPPAHLDAFAKALPHAKTRKLPGRDHQLNDDLTEVAHDIASLKS